MFKHAQINETGECFSISYLSEPMDDSLLILLTDEDDIQLGDIWDGETWTRPEPVSEPVVTSLSDRIALLEAALDELLLGGM